MQKLEEVSEYVLNYLEKRYNMDKKKLIVNSKENVSQRRKDYMKMLLNQYEKIRGGLHRLKDGSPSIIPRMLKISIKQAESVFKKEYKGKSVIPHFLCKLWKRQGKSV